MAARRNLRSISTPIILGAVSVPLSIALLVGWTLLILHNLGESESVALEVWLLVLGGISFAVIVTVLVLFSVYLAREIIELRRQTSFIDSVTHELKSPLASIKLCLETMGRHDLPPDKRDELRGMMLDDVERLTSFIDDVLQASRLADSREHATQLSPVDLGKLCRSVVASITKRRKVDRDRVRIEIPEGTVIYTDEAALTIILKNLVDNALKYSPKDAPVTVRAHRGKRGRIVLEVQDEGIGIEESELKRVFQRFYRVENPEVRSRKGTGLGLFVVSALADSLGGRVDAISAGCGKGTTMKVTLPANEDLAAATQEETA